MTDWIASAAAGALTTPILWKLIDWCLNRQAKREDADRAAHETQIQRLWEELDRVKAEQANLRVLLAAMPTKADFQRLEERIEDKIDGLCRLLSTIGGKL